MEKNIKNTKRFARLVSLVALLIPFAVITMIFFTIYGAIQQSIRQDANNPQIQMAEDASVALSRGDVPASVVPRTALIDLRWSLDPFIMVTDGSGLVLESSGMLGLNDKPLALPAGVLEHFSPTGERKITLEPEPGVRLASVIVRYAAPGGRVGYVIVGRSLREAEDRIERIGLIILVGWGVSMFGWALKELITPR